MGHPEPYLSEETNKIIIAGFKLVSSAIYTFYVYLLYVVFHNTLIGIFSILASEKRSRYVKWALGYVHDMLIGIWGPGGSAAGSFLSLRFIFEGVRGFLVAGYEKPAAAMEPGGLWIGAGKVSA